VRVASCGACFQGVQEKEEARQHATTSNKQQTTTPRTMTNSSTLDHDDVEAPPAAIAPIGEQDATPFWPPPGESLEIEQDPKRRTTPTPPWLVLIRYLAAATLALLLTVMSPQTILRGEEIHRERLLEVITIYLLTLLSLSAVFHSDPGVLTPENVAGTVEGQDQERQPTTGDTLSRREITCALPNQTNSEEEEAEFFRGSHRNVCHVCNFAPPLRAHHCRVCNKCIATFDHHCPFIGTCIGERNHCRFWWFVTFQTIGFWVYSSTVGTSKLGVWGFLRHPSVDAGTVAAAKCFLYPLTLISTIVWSMHTMFALTNLTTFECGKGPRRIDYLRGTQATDLPFSRGLDANLRLFCCQRDASLTFLTGAAKWNPILWEAPGKIVRDSEDWWEHPWQNKYWSCC
jgi:hypothetical protein